ncbi:sugar ABC transporter permease [Conexibacter stalactiti]|uniref:Sugar ABC transporter permease n=1 Tax=Conexibacter stalactiti TaxID=1940611 RepID=A0ABU4HP10_9ACTN|nr:sugar ABC transporter permease [Conexibacter stalactiti]MDW5595045.1 sugar ABC transporter permease [Conexibacter stalactiti]MEC5035687.1 sugar ABC transporter permease [Conexibacter stalactiti]
MGSAEVSTETGARRHSRALARPRHRPRLRRYGLRQSLTAYGFLAPALTLFAIFGVYTVAYGFMLSFNRWNGLSPEWEWVGLQNFKDLFSADPVLAPQVRGAVGKTAIVMVALPVLVIAISLPIAVMLNSLTRLRATLRTLYFLPYVTAGVGVYYAWRFMYEPAGAINTLLDGIGLGGLVQPDGFLGSTSTALPATLAVLVWMTVPLGILLFLTGLQTIDDSLFEAARVEGASQWTIVRRLIWPLLAPITALLVVICLREALQNFQLFLLMTNGGPVDATNVLGLEVYRLAFGRGNNNLGLASALGWALFAVALALSLLNLRIMRDRTRS